MSEYLFFLFQISEFQRGVGRNDIVKLSCTQDENLSAVFSRSGWVDSSNFAFEIDGDILDKNLKISALDLESGDIVEVRKV